ncbi:MAG: hypothetical protein NXI31_13000 [bacterium]|nr:hypothetical protein [bacterium]
MSTSGESPPPLPTGETPAAPEPVERPRATAKKRSFWRSPLGVLAALAIGVFGLAFLAVVAFGVMIELRYLPGTEAVAGDKVRDHVVELLRENGVLEPGEKVQFFYSAGLFSFLEHGSVVTDRRAITYGQYEGDEVEIWAVAFDEIESVTVEWSESMFEDSVITIVSKDEWELPLYVSTEDDGDHEFHRVLEKLWHKHR